ncbi:transporter [Rhodopseudomonas boonkerdii]|uniref:transporter n=1 Tax=Rhodopseudomonas boonkerdii TaxID=475937 RepID=UPI001E422802|nr:transporter [Rhodopseudomonas boonkerdii]
MLPSETTLAGSRSIWGAAICALLTAGGMTASAADDKTIYSLANPTPDRLMREMTTDRPDITEVPFTVDAGRVQVETTAFGYARSRPDADGTVTGGYELMGSNIRIGLTHDLEATIIVAPYARQRTVGPGVGTVASGSGAVVLRAKWNVWGNDTFGKSSSTAFAVLPYVSLPTETHNGVSPEAFDGGLQTFFAADLGGNFSFGMNAGVHSVKNLDAVGRHMETTASATLGYAWTEKFSTYGEIAARTGLREGMGDVGLVGGGMAYRITKDVQLDCGVNFGVTPASPRYSPFVGVSARF